MEEESAKIASLTLHSDAKKHIKERSIWFGTVLTSQAKLLAEFQGHDVVLKKHVAQAFDQFTRGRHPGRVRDEIFVALGGAMFGVGAENFAGEVARDEGIRAFPIVFSTTLLIAGIVAVFIFARTKP